MPAYDGLRLTDDFKYPMPFHLIRPCMVYTKEAPTCLSRTVPYARDDFLLCVLVQGHKTG